MNLVSYSIRFFLHIFIFEVALLVNLVFFLDCDSESGSGSGRRGRGCGTSEVWGWLRKKTLLQRLERVVKSKISFLCLRVGSIEQDVLRDSL
jgi:hypothetical protein